MTGAEDFQPDVMEGGRIAFDVAQLAFAKGLAFGMAIRDASPDVETAYAAIGASTIYPRMVADMLYEIVRDAAALSEAREQTGGELTVDQITGVRRAQR